MKRQFRSVVITGASSGLGAALAGFFAQPGVNLVLIARDAERTARVADICRRQGAMAQVALIDVRDTERLADTLLRADAEQPVDLVIANAGVEASLGPGRTAESLSSAIEQVRVNFEGAVATVTPLLENMRQRQRGGIVLISSLAALEPLADQPIYSATKAGVAAWGVALRTWLHPAKVTVTIAYPGFIATAMSDSYGGARPFEWSATAAARRIGEAALRGRSTVAFPWQLVWLIRLGRLVPRSLRDFVITRWLAFSITP